VDQCILSHKIFFHLFSACQIITSCFQQMSSNKRRDHPGHSRDYHSSKHSRTSLIHEISSNYSQSHSYSSTETIDRESVRNGRTDNG
ncbi:unnamed protein product, partial [Rotaria sp. Silwood2]